MKQNKKEHILNVASELFYKQGIRATGVDQVVAESKVAKMTLYNHFPSKDDLVLAYLLRRDKIWREWFEQSVRNSGNTPKEQLLAIFDTLEQWFKDPGFNGCAFIATASEFSEQLHPYHKASHEHKLLIKDFIMTIVQELDITEVDALSNSIYLLLEGAIVSAMIQNDFKSAGQAHQTTELLIDLYLSKAKDISVK